MSCRQCFGVSGPCQIVQEEIHQAVLPTDIQFDAPRVVLYPEDEVKETREMALCRTVICQQNLKRYHAQKVNPRTFQVGDLVLRLKQGTEGRHKLPPPWEGPFIVSQALHNDAYYLIDAQAPRKNKADRSGEETKRPWNIALLRPFYTQRENVCISVSLVCRRCMPAQS
jgi:hypothetical protein